MWFVNSGSGGDLKEAHGSRDVPISSDDVRTEGIGEENNVSRVGRSDDGFDDAQTSRSTTLVRRV